ncbi:MAG: chorismate-binding protein, partial [Bacteroidota bacterium]
MRIISIDELEDLPGLFSEIEESIGNGFFVAGYFAYECGYHFENITPEVPLRSSLPLAWFGVYRSPLVFNHQSGTFEGEQPIIPRSSGSKFSLKRCSLKISEPEYNKAIEIVKDYIVAGDTYQVNFTDKYTFEFDGSPTACFAALREKQKVGYGAFINAKGKDILSFSPELFFKLSGRTITTRPMKGTARRGKYLSEDESIKNWLQNDEKNRSENLMIVDLLRNDIGRVAEIGSVVVKEMFAVEKYETLFQMTSTIQGTLRNKLPLYELFKSVFPSGSVTGAPKIRTMQIIRRIEHEPRGVYTGAIGYFSPE